MSREPRQLAWVVRLTVARLLVVSFLAAVCLPSSPALAGQLGAFAPSKPAASSASEANPSTGPEERPTPDSPRAALTAFTQLTGSGDYVNAARYLDLSSVDQSDGPLLAQRLRDVLDRHLWVDLNKLSPNPEGNTGTGLAADRLELGNVPGATGKPEPVVIVRQVEANGARWVFSASTVEHIDVWYQHLENRWLLERLPQWALRFGPHELRWWQWLALAPLLLVGILVGFVMRQLSRAAIKHLVSERGAENARKMRAPAGLAWTVVTCYALLPWLGLYEPADNFVRRGLSAALLVALFWALWKAVELSQHVVSRADWVNDSQTAASLLMLGARLGKFVVAAFAFVAVLAELGYPVTSIVTGLGIGGIALALAAQKTVENLFGAFSLAVDQPFRQGDVIQVDGISGTVEAIGLRSTRIRTVERTLISIPNGKLAEMRVETISARDRTRFYCMLGIAHSPAQHIIQILDGIRSLLDEHQSTVKSSISVRLVAITDSAMNLEVAALMDTSNYDRFQELRQGLLLAIVQVVDGAGTTLAHPVSSIRVTEIDRRQLGQVPALAATAKPESG